jgi:hypothetical protein
MLDKAWSLITIDFIVKLPPLKDPLTGIVYNSILVINNRLIKFVRLILYKEASNTEALAYTFIQEVIVNHGTPNKIIID